MIGSSWFLSIAFMSLFPVLCAKADDLQTYLARTT